MLPEAYIFLSTFAISCQAEIFAWYAFTKLAGQPANDIDSAFETTSAIVFESDTKFLSILYTDSIAIVSGGF
jgi:hypothetical protein